MEINPGISDEDVIRHAKSNKRILITEDKDFGEWVFAHKVRGLTIIFLRYEKQDLEQIIEFLNELIIELTKEDLEAPYQFITINRNKVRRRRI